MMNVERLYQGVTVHAKRQVAKQVQEYTRLSNKIDEKKSTTETNSPKLEKIDKTDDSPFIFKKEEEKNRCGISGAALASNKIIIAILEYLVPLKEGAKPLKAGGSILNQDEALPGIEVFKLSICSKQFFFLMHTVFTPLKYANYR